MDETAGGERGRELTDALGEIDELIEHGQYTGAQGVCRELLGRHPTSSAVHEKMADILYHRQLWQDAAEWYQLAAQLSDTPELQAKLRDARHRAEEARLVGPEPEEAAARAAARNRRLLLLLGVAAVLTMVVAAVVIVRLLRRPEMAPPRTMPEQVEVAEAPRAFRLSGPRAARGVRPSPRAPSSAAGAEAHEIPEAHWAAAEAPPRTPQRPATKTTIQQISEPLTDLDHSVISAVSSLTWGEGLDLSGQVSAMVFPHTGYAVISVTIPRSLPEGDLLERVVRQAHRVCLTAIRAEEGIRAITIRMLKPPSGSRHPVIAFSGNTDRKTLQQYRDSNLEFGVLWDHVFESVWWNPRVGGSMPVEMQQRSAAGLP